MLVLDYVQNPYICACVYATALIEIVFIFFFFDDSAFANIDDKFACILTLQPNYQVWSPFFLCFFSRASFQFCSIIRHMRKSFLFVFQYFHLSYWNLNRTDFYCHTSSTLNEKWNDKRISQHTLTHINSQNT